MCVRTRHGFTLIEVLLVVMLIGILAALSAPFLLAARSSANEASAVGSLKALNSGQETFAAVCGRGNYTDSLDTLVDERFVSPDLDISPKSGFIFALSGDDYEPRPADCTGQASRSGYYFSAEPLSASTGRRAFATNQVGTIWQDTSGTAPTEPFVAGGTVSPLTSQ